MDNVSIYWSKILDVSRNFSMVVILGIDAEIFCYGGMLTSR